MKRIAYFIMSSMIIFSCGISSAQSFDLLSIPQPPSADHQVDVAVVINDKICDKDYFISGKPKISLGHHGTLSIRAKQNGTGCRKPSRPIPFQIAIRNNEAKTMWILTSEPVLEMDIQDVLKQCAKGDELLFMPTESRYKMQHYAMPVMVGC